LPIEYGTKLSHSFGANVPIDNVLSAPLATIANSRVAHWLRLVIDNV